MIMQTQDLLSIKEVAKQLPHQPHVATVWRWVQKGVRGRRLKSTKLAGRTFIHVNDLNTFLFGDEQPQVRTDRAAELRRVSRELDAELS